jgi:cephalosporin hydroxylase
MANNLRAIANKSKASQGKLELFHLLNILSPNKPNVIVEIGVHLGYSMEVWKEAFKPDILIGIDNDLNDYKKRLGDKIPANILEADSHAKQTLALLKKKLKGRHIDFLFIDGDHTYKGVKLDYEMYSPLVANGGLICFHDACITDHPDVKVHQFFDELASSSLSAIRAVKYQEDANGIGLIYV